jgi:hypothetical protein
MKKDPDLLIEVWKDLRAKKNVLLFIDTTDQFKDTDLIMNWFNPSIKEKITNEDALMKNGSFLCIRRVLETMPPINNKTIGAYTIKFLNVSDMLNIREILKD